MNGQFIAVGQDGLRISSANGADWSEPQVGKEGQVYRCLAIGEGTCVAFGGFGGKNVIAITRDGMQWEIQEKDAKYVKYVLTAHHAKGRFLALGGDRTSVGNAEPFAITSPDGKNWSDYQSIAGKHNLYRLAYGNGIYVGVGMRGRRAVSPDGLQWKDAPDLKAIYTLVDITFGNNLFVGVGLHGLRMTTTDGVNWSKPVYGEEGEHLNSILWTGQQFVGVGQGATYVSPDGQKWERRPNQDAPLMAAYGNGVFAGVHWKGRILLSRNAVDWKQVYKAPHHLEAIAFG
ncbi:MAG: hypothetical protein OHK0029_08080 [Armatimonadaceae bacterium]